MKISKTKKSLDPIAISYLRFSSVAQLQGDSIRRQTELAEEWSEENGIPIVQTMEDLGLSASCREHLRKGDLGNFLELCRTEEMLERTKIRDVYLLVESLDRLSREKIMVAVAQLAEIVESGVKVVTLMDGKVFDRESLNDVGSLIISITVMSRAFEEIASKSKRIRDAMDEKKKDAVANGTKISARCPACFRLSKDRKTFEIYSPGAKVVRRIFRMAADGFTTWEITKVFNKEGVPKLSVLRGLKQNKRWNSLWNPKLIEQVLVAKYPIGTKETETCRIVDGKKVREKGEDIPGYYPPVIDEATWAKAREGIVRRKGKVRKQRSGKTSFNLFPHIAFDKKTGEAIYYVNNGNGKRYLTPAGIRLGKRSGSSWNLDHFERIFFHTITRALDVKGSLVREEENLARIEDEIADLDRRKEKWMDLIEDGEPDPDVLARLAKFREVKSFKVSEKDEIEEKIRIGNGRTTLDPDADRESKRRAIRANVERIDMDCERKTFRVLLKNGISFDAQHDEKSGIVTVSSDSFEFEKFDAPTLVQIANEGKKGKKRKVA